MADNNLVEENDKIKLFVIMKSLIKLYKINKNETFEKHITMLKLVDDKSILRFIESMLFDQEINFIMMFNE
jgi:hypothetical protein